jgi:hypothetical protein
MRYQTGTAFRRALETRLADRARNDGVSIQRLRQAVAFERLLARLPGRDKHEAIWAHIHDRRGYLYCGL